jgi:hypothetical protein
LHNNRPKKSKEAFMKLQLHIALTALSLTACCQAILTDHGPENKTFSSSSSSSSNGLTTYQPNTCSSDTSFHSSISSTSTIQPAPTYSFDKTEWGQGLFAGITVGIIGGGIAGAGAYALCKNDHRLQANELKCMVRGVGSAAALVAGSFSMWSARKTLNEIKKTRNNRATNPKAYNAQILALLQPTLKERTEEVQGRINDLINDKKQIDNEFTERISAIEQAHEETKTLPKKIRVLEETDIPSLERTYDEHQARYNEIRNSGIQVTDQDRKLAETAFDSALTTAQAIFEKHKKYRKPGEEIHSLNYFLSSAIQSRIPDASSLISPTGILTPAGNALRSEIIKADALIIAHDRYNLELSNAQNASSQARSQLTASRQKLARLQQRLEEALAHGYGDLNNCRSDIESINQEAADANRSHTEKLEALTQEKNAAATPSKDNWTNAENELTASCSSENHSWYRGLLHGGLATSAIAIIVSVTNYFFSK